METDLETGNLTAVDVGREGYVGRITLARPDAMNTFSTQLAVELDEALRILDATEGTRAIVIDGAGQSFSAGIDLTEHAEHDTEAEWRTWVERMERPFLTITEIDTPVIAAIHGHAAANGIGLVAACDLAVAGAGTMFGATAPKVGLFCMGPAVPLLEALPRKRALELLLTGDLIDAETARDWGLVNRVIPEGEHVDGAMDLAQTISAKSPVAIRRGKRTVSEMLDMDYDEALAHANDAFAALCATEDAHEGIEAFLEGEPLDADAWPVD